MSRRIERINELLQQELSKIILKEDKKESQDYLLTILEVQAANDLKTAKVWVSVLGTEVSKQKKIIQKLQNRAFGFQKILNRRLDLKFIPKLFFKLDKTGETAQKIDQILDQEK